MMVGMIGCLGSAAVIKKLGGYANTKVSSVDALRECSNRCAQYPPSTMSCKYHTRHGLVESGNGHGSISVTHSIHISRSCLQLHGILSWSGIMCSFGGLYAIYKNKENRGAQHWQTNHAMAGLACILSCIGLGLIGAVVLHPDFGIDKGNKTIRYVSMLLADAQNVIEEPVRSPRLLLF